MVHGFQRVVLAISAVALMGASAPSPSAPPASAKELESRFQTAVNAHDAKAVDALVYWGTADSSSRELTEMALSIYEAETITSSKLAPLDRSTPSTFTMNGHTYGPSIPPVYTVVVQYAHGPNVKVDEGSFVIGQKAGAWYLVAIARLR